jgi:hypothetical protein
VTPEGHAALAPPGWEPVCRRCYGLIDFHERATACDTCSYTVCEACVPVGSPIVCPDCPLALRPAGAGVAAGTTAPAPTRTEFPRGRGRSAPNPGNGLLIPAPCRIELKRGPLDLVPNAAVNADLYLAAPPLRKARLALLACIPPASARGRQAAVAVFSSFLRQVAKVPWSSLTSDDVADFVLWRAAPPTDAGVPPPPRGPVEPSTALSDLAHLRAHARLTGDGVLPRLYGHQVSETLRRLGAGERHDSVRKTPVDLADVARAVERAEAPRASVQDRSDAFLLALGLFLFLRAGECGFPRDRLLVSPDGIGLVFVAQKTRPGPAAKRVTRLCCAPLLVRAHTAFRAQLQKLRPSEPVFRNATGGPLAAQDVRTTLLRVLGPPPVLVGETRALPWSLRAGGATMCFHSGMAPDRIMRLGRWSSEVAMMYAVLSARVQTDTWLGTFSEEWYGGVPPAKDADAADDMGVDP